MDDIIRRRWICASWMAVSQSPVVAHRPKPSQRAINRLMRLTSIVMIFGANLRRRRHLLFHFFLQPKISLTIFAVEIQLRTANQVFNSCSNTRWDFCIDLFINFFFQFQTENVKKFNDTVEAAVRTSLKASIQSSGRNNFVFYFSDEKIPPENSGRVR